MRATQSGLIARAQHVGNVAKAVCLLLCSIRNSLRTTRLRRDTGKSAQDPWDRSVYSGLEKVAIDTKRGSNASDHVGRQELHNQ
jgi:hypothetical protein